MTVLARIFAALNREIVLDDLRSFLPLLSSPLLGREERRHKLTIDLGEDGQVHATLPDDQTNLSFEWKLDDARFGNDDDHARLRSASREYSVILRIPPRLRFSFDAIIPGQMGRDADEVLKANFSSWAPFDSDDVFHRLRRVEVRSTSTILSVVYTPRTALRDLIAAIDGSGLGIDGLEFGDEAIVPFANRRFAPIGKLIHRYRHRLLLAGAVSLTLVALLAWEGRLTSAESMVRSANTARLDAIRALKLQHDALPEPKPTAILPSAGSAVVAASLSPTAELRRLEVGGEAIHLTLNAESAEGLAATLGQRLTATIEMTRAPNAPLADIVIRIGGTR